jgi:crotonobetainyl-CoA:carnitine CoA-transferase CaiB-like acyl-CoA transferase
MIDADRLARESLVQVLGELRLSIDDAAGAVRIEGDDFPRMSRHRLATASAVALTALGIAAATLWKERGGRRQDVSVVTARALQALRCAAYVEQNGYSLPVQHSNPLTTMHQTKDDRWIYVVAGHPVPQFLDRALKILDCPHDGASIASAIARWDGLGLEAALAEQSVPGSVVRTAAEWRNHPQGHWLAAQPVVAMERLDDSPPHPIQLAPRPAAGLRVLDLTHVICGPMVSRCLAEHGADVLHARLPFRTGSPAVALDTAWGKRSALVDLDRPTDAERVRSLVKSADVLVQSYRPGALMDRGLGPHDAAALRPGLIYVSVSCYGSGGPWASRRGYDPNAMCVTGVADDEGDGDEPRLPATGWATDYLAAYLAAAGVFAALVHRAREGGSWHVVVSLARSSMWLQDLGLFGRQDREVAAGWEDPVVPEFILARSPFGTVRALRPPVEFSITSPSWDRPPEPPGASDLTWLPLEP